jgi:MraZ protein
LADGSYLTMGQDGCIYAFPAEEWNRISDQLGEVSITDQGGRAYTRFFFGYAEHVELDSQGRLLVPQRLRSSVGVGREVVVVGVQDRMEIWDAEVWERYQESFSGAYRAGTLYPGEGS